MTAKPLVGPHIQAKGYSRGRTFREAKEVDWLVIHTAQGATDELALGSFFSRTSNGSSQAGIGQDGGYASYVNYADTCWAAPPLNQEADHLEICGFAEWSRAKWLTYPKMLETVAQWIAWRCSVRKIPIRHVSKPSLGTSGVTGHIDVNNTYRQSDHWDPGPGFPWDTVIARANVIASVKPALPPKVIIVAPGAKYRVVVGDSYWKIAQGAYKNGDLWPAIAKANKNVALTPGMLIIIPNISSSPTSTSPSKPAPSKPARIDLPAWPGYGYIAVGKHNSYVLKMQIKLRAIGYTRYMPAGADGVYGSQTTVAVRAYQLNKKLTVDGKMGPTTWASLDAAVL